MPHTGCLRPSNTPLTGLRSACQEGVASTPHNSRRGEDLRMTLDAVQFVSLLLNGVASGVVLSHVLERPGKVALAPATYVQVQQMLFRTYGPAVGALETLALLATATWWALDRAWLVGLAVLADTA